MQNIVCDGCDKPVTHDDDLVQVRQPRPSDPQDLCCILAGHTKCFGRQHPENHFGSVPEVMTGRDWDRWVEAHGPTHGILWLS